MKSLILLLALTVTLGAAEITFTIPNNKIDSLASAIAYYAPVPLDTANNPIMTKRQWAKEYYRQHMIRVFRKWKKNLAQQNIKSDTTVVE